MVGELSEEPAKQKATVQGTSHTKALGRECVQGPVSLARDGGWGRKERPIGRGLRTQALGVI